MRNVLFVGVLAAMAGALIGCNSTAGTQTTRETMVSAGNGRAYVPMPENQQVAENSAKSEQPYSVYGQSGQKAEAKPVQPALEMPQPANAWAPNAPR